jgi:hypothetical protein
MLRQGKCFFIHLFMLITLYFLVNNILRIFVECLNFFTSLQVYEALLFCGAIIMRYNMQTNVQMFGHVPPPITWFICQTIDDCLSHVVFACVLNQFTRH